MIRWRPTYTVMDRLMASPSAPMPQTKAQHQLLRMYQALRALETAAAPTPDDWRVVSDAVNLMETLVSMGHAQDASGLLQDAVAALSVAGVRYVDDGQPIRLSGAGIQAVRFTGGTRARESPTSLRNPSESFGSPAARTNISAPALRVHRLRSSPVQRMVRTERI